MIIALVISLTIAVISIILLSIRLCKSRKANNKHKQYIAELRDLIAYQKEVTEQCEALITENQRLMAEKAAKSKWIVGNPINKTPNSTNGNSKNDT